MQTDLATEVTIGRIICYIIAMRPNYTRAPTHIRRQMNADDGGVDFLAEFKKK